MSHSLFDYIEVHDHVCMVFKTRKEQLSSITQFMQIGLKRSEKCVCIAAPDNTAAVFNEMEKAGIKTDRAVKSGALSVITHNDAYLKPGHFDLSWMLNFIKEAEADAKSAGFKALRVIGDMSWAVKEDPTGQKLTEYETKVNRLFPRRNILAVCQYDSSLFSQKLLDNIINIHPCCWM